MATIQRTIYVRAGHPRLNQIADLVAKIASGQAEAGRFGRALQIRIGTAVLAKVKEAFIVKSHGGVDECGERWKPLSKKTIAYDRRHPEKSRLTLEPLKKKWLPKGEARAKYAPSYQLTEKQRNRWWELYRGFGGNRPGRNAYHQGNMKSWAAARAWNILKGEGARTLMMVYGGAQVDILRDIGTLYNSLSPGYAVGEQVPAGIPKVPNQVFKVGPGSVVVGTNRKWAYTHHYGTRTIPQRRLWPNPSQWTGGWWELIQRQGLYGLLDIAEYLLRGQ